MRLSVSSPTSKLQNWLWKIKEASTNGRWQEVFTHYNEMKKTQLHLSDPSLFPPILKACLGLSIKHGHSIHGSLIKQGLEAFPSVSNSIMDFYVKTGSFSSSLTLFDKMSFRDSVSWNIMIHANLDQGFLEEGLRLFVEGRIDGFEPNNGSLVLLIQACRTLKATHEGLQMHSYVIRTGFWEIGSVQNALLSMYVDIDFQEARQLFDEMSDRDLISWSVMIGGYVQSEEPEVAFQLFRGMICMNEFEMDGQIMVLVMKACVQLGKIRIVRLVHGFLTRKGFFGEGFVGNSLVDMYSKCRDMDSALTAFTEMPCKNIVSWNSLLSGFVINEEYSRALTLFYSMQKAGFGADEVTLVNLLQICKLTSCPSNCKSIHSMIVRQRYETNKLVMNSLIDSYAKSDLIKLAWKLFNRMTGRDTVTWSTMIAGFTHCGMPDEAIGVFLQMCQVHNKPNAVTLLNLLEACSVSADLEKSKVAHCVAIRRDLATDVAVGTAILDMYSKCGAVEASAKVFDQIPCKSIVTWGAMIAAYGMNGLPHSAIALLRKMNAQGVKPNPVTTLSLLSACSHGGLVKEGLSFFDELAKDPSVELTSEHYSCVVDLLARAGLLESAMELIKKIPNGLKPSASAWGALLSACRSRGDSKLGEDVVSHILELEPLNSAGYVLASSMYASGRSWDEAARMRCLVKERGVKMVPGYSLVHVYDKACKFVAGDNRHSFSDVVNHVNKQLHLSMKMDKKLDEAVVE